MWLALRQTGDGEGSGCRRGDRSVAAPPAPRSSRAPDWSIVVSPRNEAHFRVFAASGCIARAAATGGAAGVGGEVIAAGIGAVLAAGAAGAGAGAAVVGTTRGLSFVAPATAAPDCSAGSRLRPAAISSSPTITRTVARSNRPLPVSCRLSRLSRSIARRTAAKRYMDGAGDPRASLLQLCSKCSRASWSGAQGRKAQQIRGARRHGDSIDLTGRPCLMLECVLLTYDNVVSGRILNCCIMIRMIVED